MKKFETEIGGKKLSVEIGKLAQQASGSVVCQYGDTTVLATAVMSATEREGIDFFPLQVEYEERLYAAGKIKSSRFIKREGRATDEAVLTGRLVDRAIRPLFPHGIKNEVQVILTVLSVDQENDPDVPAMIGAALALSISDIPWEGPLGGIRIGRINGEWVINPSYEARVKSEIDLFIAGTHDKVLMLEAGAQQAGEEVCADAIEFCLKHLGKVCAFISDIQSQVGVAKKTVADLSKKKVEEESEEETVSPEQIERVMNWIKEKAPAHLTTGANVTKKSRKASIGLMKTELEEHLKQEQVGKDKRKKLLALLDEEAEALVTRAILDKEQRVDGRALTEIRPLSVEVGVLPRLHGTGLFSRGETQVLSAVTLGAPGDEQILDGMEEVGKKRYMHHYNFPPYSVGEVKPMRGPGRREIGHGALAEKALLPVLPSKEEFPYTIRVVSEVLGSNGSSSMASTCGSTLALMDAGVPINAPVAGIAMGLASDTTGRYKILTDLQDLEDGEGGMDFKVAGTTNGITAIQLDTKTKGLTMEIVKETLQRARDARLQILDAMTAVIAAPRAELSRYAPRIVSLRINPDKIRDVIGPGGKVINEIIDATGVDIDIEQDGLVMVTSTNAEGMEKAVEWIKRLTREVKVGEMFEGKVMRTLDFGAFVEVLPRQEGLVHISELAPYRVKQVSDIVKIGQTVTVKVIGIDEQGRINLSMKRAQPQNQEEHQQHS
ncbi:polyribonucleotide nucleotidyltransferase [Candidatus Uhrbacteria bacterium]|nr:polyribonucleotide nucleotidyltransferase [Candidatus Uhrbacteria bacterium]